MKSLETVDDKSRLIGGRWGDLVNPVLQDDLLLEGNHIHLPVRYGGRTEFGKLSQPVIRVAGAFAVPEFRFRDIGSVKSTEYASDNLFVRIIGQGHGDPEYAAASIIAPG